MTAARDQYLEGLDLGWSNERDGILDPAASAGRPGSPLTDGVRRGRAAWRREVAGAAVVDRPSLASLPEPDPLTPEDIDRFRAESAEWRRAMHEYTLAAERNERR